MSDIKCPVCDEGLLYPETYWDLFHVSRDSEEMFIVRDLECYRCDTCEADPVLDGQIIRNNIRIETARKEKLK